jgi:hypothetical protein
VLGWATKLAEKVCEVREFASFATASSGAAKSAHVRCAAEKLK